MPVTSWKSPTANGFTIQGNNHNQWTNPTNAYAADTTYATAVDSSTKYQTYGDFSFGIPANSIIDGIEIETVAHKSGGTTYLFYRVGYQDRTNGGYNATGLITLTSGSDITDIQGSSTTKYGNTDSAQLADGYFWIALGIASIAGADTAYVDSVRVRVYYTLGGGGFFNWFNDID